MNTAQLNMEMNRLNEFIMYNYNNPAMGPAVVQANTRLAEIQAQLSQQAYANRQSQFQPQYNANYNNQTGYNNSYNSGSMFNQNSNIMGSQINSDNGTYGSNNRYSKRTTTKPIMSNAFNTPNQPQSQSVEVELTPLPGSEHPFITSKGLTSIKKEMNGGFYTYEIIPNNEEIPNYNVDTTSELTKSNIKTSLLILNDIEIDFICRDREVDTFINAFSSDKETMSNSILPDTDSPIISNKSIELGAKKVLDKFYTKLFHLGCLANNVSLKIDSACEDFLTLSGMLESESFKHNKEAIKEVMEDVKEVDSQYIVFKNTPIKVKLLDDNDSDHYIVEVFTKLPSILITTDLARQIKTNKSVSEYVQVSKESFRSLYKVMESNLGKDKYGLLVFRTPSGGIDYYPFTKGSKYNNFIIAI